MTRKSDTGEGDDYTSPEEAALEAAIEAAYLAWEDDAEPSRADVRAQIEWAGTVMPTNNGVRRTRLDLPREGMRKVRKAVEKAKRAKDRRQGAKPAVRYQAKSWHAKLADLTKTQRGSEAADRAGLSPSLRTLGKWLSDPEYPIRKGDRERIDKAYEELRNWGVTEAKTAEEKADHEVSEAMTQALKDQYGPNIRFRNIERFDFE